MNTNGYRNDYRSGYSSRDPLPPKKNKHLFEKTLLIGLLLFIVGSLGYNQLKKYIETRADQTEEIIKSVLGEEVEDAPETAMEMEEDYDDVIAEPSVSTSEERELTTTAMEEDAPEPRVVEPMEQQEQSGNYSSYAESRQRKTEGRNEEAKTEASTSEILERMTRKNVVEQAKRAGVSTEGSTSEILERMTHKNVVDQAKRAGVSTEGSTSDILERITHKNVVEQAKRAGVSTEGSTSDILERMTRKSLEKYGH